MTLRSAQAAEDEPTLHLPRILCLHGGGSNATIFRLQCRKLNASLRPYFRLVFADAPFLSQAGPCVLSVYTDYGPFRRWLRWSPEHPEISAATAVSEIEDSLRNAMDEDDRRGATGEWVGVLGFSQGAKISASLLFHQQVCVEKMRSKQLLGRRMNFSFAVLLAGQGPLVSLDPELIMTPALHDASMISTGGKAVVFSEEEQQHILRAPTIHVHGLRDPGLKRHRVLLEKYCEKGSTRLIEWDGDHRVPLRSKDVSMVVQEILDISRKKGVLRE